MPDRCIDWHTTFAASSVTGVSFNAPPNLPMAVRTALRTTTSRTSMVPFLLLSLIWSDGVF